MRTVVLDLHGVLVDSKRVKENYEIFLTNIYAEFNINKQKAVEYHNQGLYFFLKSIDKIKSKNLIDDQFLEEMNRIDIKWDNLMSSHINKEDNNLINRKIESRDIEEKSGRIRNVFYPDSENFLKYWSKNLQSEYKLIIASNSHYSHIKGVISGLDTDLLKIIQIIGWETTKCLKSHPKYFLRLKKVIKENIELNSPIIMIGNSDNEIIGSLKEKMLPILINRDSEISDYAFKKSLKDFDTLEGVWDFIFSLN